MALSAGVAYLVRDGCSIPRQGQASLTLLGMAQQVLLKQHVYIAVNQQQFWFPEEAVHISWSLEIWHFGLL